MKKLILWLIIILIIGFFAYRVIGPKKFKEEEKVKTKGIPVELQSVKTGEITEIVSLSGTIKSENEINVVTKLGGKVKRVYCEEGDYVRKGQLLIKLEDDEIIAQLNQAKAALEMAKTRLKLAQTGARPQERKQVDNAVDMAKAGLDVAESNYNRMKNLYESKAISKQQFEGVEMQYKLAKAQYDSALQGKSIVDEGAREEDKEAAEAGVNQAKAAVSYVKTMLKNTNVYAPTSGVVSMRMVDVGEMAAPGYPLVILVDNNNLYFEAQISEKDSEKIKEGQSVKFTVDAIPKKLFSGKVIEVIPAIESFSRSAKVKVSVEDNEGSLKSGMFTRGNIVIQEKKESIIIPKECIKKVGNKNIVFAVINNIAKEKEIKVGIITDIDAEIIDGVKEGEKVVIAGQNILKDGDRVNIVKE